MKKISTPNTQQAVKQEAFDRLAKNSQGKFYLLNSYIRRVETRYKETSRGSKNLILVERVGLEVTSIIVRQTR